MRDWIPVPGSVKARLVEAALRHFEADGYDAASVVAMAQAAGVTTGALYHHFGSKAGLFAVVRTEMDRRIRDRMEGAAAAVGGDRAGLTAALLVGFDAAVELRAVRILSEAGPPGAPDTVLGALAGVAAGAPPSVAAIVLGAWRTGLARVAADGDPREARRGLEWLLDAGGSGT